MLTSCLLVLALPASPFLQDCASTVDVEAYGSGTLGAAGVPRLIGEGAPVLGGPYSLRLTDGAPDGVGLVAVSASAAQIPLPGFGGELLIGSALVVEPFVTDSGGEAAGLVAATVSPSACGLEAFVQGALVDPTAQGGVALTSALALRFGAAPESLFPTPRVASVGAARNLELTDLDGDGDLDLLSAPMFVAPPATGAIRIQLNSGDGSFESPTFVLDVEGLRDLDVADLNGDGRVDLIGLTIFPSASQTLELVALFGADGPTWTPAAISPANVSSTEFELGDVNADGLADVVLVRNDFELVELLIGDGAGSFVLSDSRILSDDPLAAQVVDLNSDGHEDLVVTLRKAGISIFLGSASGISTNETLLPILGEGENSVSLVEDLDGDGDNDLVVVRTDGRVFVFTLEGGALEALDELSVSGDVADLKSADVNGDGVLDIAFSSRFSDSVSVFFGSPLGGFEAAEVVRLVTDPAHVAAGDVDGDGAVELFVASPSSQGFYQLLGLASGAADAPLVVETGDFLSSTVLAEDLDDDGEADLFVASGSSGLAFLRGLGDGQFEDPVEFALPVTIQHVALGDFDGDGDADLAYSGGSAFGAMGVGIVRNEGGGSFVVGPLTSTPDSIGALGVGDVDGDQRAEVAILTASAALSFDVQPDASLVQAAIVNVQTPGIGVAVELVDLNGDGNLDLGAVCGLSSGPSVACIALGAGDGTFAAIQTVPSIANSFEAIEYADVDGDGDQDLVFTDGFSGLLLARSNGDGSFVSTTPIIALAVESFLVSDIDSDGSLDILGVVEPGELVLLRNDGLGVFTEGGRFGTAQDLHQIGVADLDGDGDDDLVAVRGEDPVLIFNRLLE
ncbi:MAG: VCBS repeat-containing protein [Planctomycetota bacterium]